MAFDLEDGRKPVTDINSTGVFTRALDNLRALGRQCLQPYFGRFVGAVLRPHGGKNTEFAEVWRAADPRQDQVPLFL